MITARGQDKRKKRVTEIFIFSLLPAIACHEAIVVKLKLSETTFTKGKKTFILLEVQLT